MFLPSKVDTRLSWGWGWGVTGGHYPEINGRQKSICFCYMLHTHPPSLPPPPSPGPPTSHTRIHILRMHFKCAGGLHCERHRHQTVRSNTMYMYWSGAQYPQRFLIICEFQVLMFQNDLELNPRWDFKSLIAVLRSTLNYFCIFGGVSIVSQQWQNTVPSSSLRWSCGVDGNVFATRFCAVWTVSIIEYFYLRSLFDSFFIRCPNLHPSKKTFSFIRSAFQWKKSEKSEHVERRSADKQQKRKKWKNKQKEEDDKVVNKSLLSWPPQRVVLVTVQQMESLGRAKHTQSYWITSTLKIKSTHTTAIRVGSQTTNRRSHIEWVLIVSWIISKDK